MENGATPVGVLIIDSVPAIRQVRRIKIESVAWAVDRHLRQIRLGIPTTLTHAEARELDEHIQALCDFPATLDPLAEIPRGDVCDGLPWPLLRPALLAKVSRRGECA